MKTPIDCVNDIGEYFEMSSGALIAILEDNEFVYVALKNDPHLMWYDDKTYENILKGRKIDRDEFLRLWNKLMTREEFDRINKEAWNKIREARAAKKKSNKIV